MQNDTIKKDKVKLWVIRILLIIFDIVAVNFAYFMALVLRFYVNNEFHIVAEYYLPLFWKFAPYYTVCCIIVFILFRLYSGMWGYAGINDVNRIIIASVITCVVQVVGTLVFTARMPITYYALGAIIQFVLICASRLSYRIFAVEFSKFNKGKGTVLNVMIIGAGEAAKTLIKQLYGHEDNIVKPVCILDTRIKDSGRLFDGLPIIPGIDRLEQSAEKYNVKYVVIADTTLPAAEKEKIRAFCNEHDIVVQDYYGIVQESFSGLSFRKLMGYVKGPVTVYLGEYARHFDNANDAMMAISGKYIISSVSTINDGIAVEIRSDNTILNDMNEDWVKSYEQETGEEVSFF